MGWLTARISSAFTVGAYTGGGTGTSNRASIVENQSLTFRVDDPTGDSVAGEPLTRFQIAFLDGSLSETLPTSFALEDFGAGGQLRLDFSPTLFAVVGNVTSVSFSAVPLPAALPLILTSLAGLGAMGWRRRKTT